MSETNDRAGLIEHYDRIAPAYRELYETPSALTSFYRSRQECVYDVLSDVSSRDLVLEIGCAAGLMVDFFLQKGAQYRGMDISPGMIEECRRRYVDQPARFKVGDVCELEFPAEMFDLVLCIGVLEYVQDEQRAIEEIARVLKRTGTVVLSGIDKWSPRNTFNYIVQRKLRRIRPACILHEYHTERDYIELLHRAGLDVDEVRHFNFPLLIEQIAKSRDADADANGGGLRIERSWLRHLGSGFLLVASPA